MIIWLVLLLLALCVLYWYQRLRLKNRPPLLHGAWPIIGHSFMALTDLQRLIEDESNKILSRGSEIVTVRLGAWDVTAVIEPDDCLLVANSSTTKDSLYDLLKPYFGEGLITSNGLKWLTHRRLLNPSFNQQVLDGYLSEFNKGAKELLLTIDSEVGKGPFDHYVCFEHSILSTVCVTTIGTVTDKEDERNMESFINAKTKFYNCMLQRVVKFWLQSDLIYALSGLKKQEDMYAESMRELSLAILKKKQEEFVINKVLGKDLGSKTRFKPLMDHLIELIDAGELSDQDVIDQMNTFIAAGADTISVALPHVFLCVGSYTEVQQQIFAELQVVFGGSDRDVTKQDLAQLKYLEAVVKETLRLYPPVPLIGRTLDIDLQIKGYTLPAGSKCYLCLYGLQRHPTWGPDAAEFRPERWLDGSLPANLKIFCAFGIGKRSCVGVNFTFTLMKTYLATLLRKFTVSGDVTQLVQTFEVLSRPMSGHHVSIERRL